MRVTFLALGLLFSNSLADDARLTLTKSGYSLAVAGDGRVTRWTSPVFTLTGLRAGDRVLWARTLLEKKAYADDKMRLFWQENRARPATFALSIWEDPGQHMRVTALVFHAGTEVPKRGHLKNCDVRLDLVVRVADGQSATTRSGDLVARLVPGRSWTCAHVVELQNRSERVVTCELEIVAQDERRGARVRTTVELTPNAKRRVHLDGKLDVGSRWHACRIRVHVKGRKKTLTLHTRPWVSPTCDRGGDPEPPPPPPENR